MRAIVFTTNTGHTIEYVRILSEKTGLSAYSLESSLKELPSRTEIIYCGWLFANTIKGYKKAAKHFNIKAVCAVGLCDTGTAIDEVRKSNSISENIPLFTMQGGINKVKLRGINKFMIKMLMKSLSSKKDLTSDEKRMLELLNSDKNYVNEENTVEFMKWYNSHK